MPYNNLDYSILDNYNNGNIVLNAASGYLYLGYANTQMLNFLNDKAILSSTTLSMNVNIVFAETGTTGNASGLVWSGSTDNATIYYSVPEADKGILVINAGDDANAAIWLSNSGQAKLTVNGTDVHTYAPILNDSVNGTTTSDATGAVLLCSKVANNTGIFNGNGDGPGSNGTADLIIKSWYGIGFVDGCTSAGMTASINCRTGEITGVKVWGAQWNDYAECRMAHETEPGRCVMESSVGMIRTAKRLMPGCKIVSDTYGLCMGKTDMAKTPIAVAGRVLAYPTRAREEYELGAAVCSGPNGTVDIMTREEIMMYPERIVGTVSEIPTYDVWHAGSKEVPQDIQVDGRIWIYVR